MGTMSPHNKMYNTVTGLFADMPILGQDILLACQFAGCGRFVERRFADKLDYSLTNCLKAPLYLLPLRDELGHVVRYRCQWRAQGI